MKASSHQQKRLRLQSRQASKTLSSSKMALHSATTLQLVVSLFLLLQCTIISTSAQYTDSFAYHDVCITDDECANGGTCRDANVSKMGYRHCHCKPEYSGSHCTIHCPLTCHNGGRCQKTPEAETESLVDSDTDGELYNCKCFGHFTGKFCEVPYINCGDAERCFNGGTCVVRDGVAEDTKSTSQHHCSCPEGWTGNSCEERAQTTTQPKEDADTDSSNSTSTNTATDTTAKDDTEASTVLDDIATTATPPPSTAAATPKGDTHSDVVRSMWKKVSWAMMGTGVVGLTFVAVAWVSHSRRTQRITRQHQRLSQKEWRVDSDHDEDFDDEFTIHGVEDMSKIHISRGLMLNVI